ncbi:MAG: YfhO family protein [Proteobacteria bacterium]|nr:YfhO family protein [Pseudomonadota bacterium]
MSREFKYSLIAFFAYLVLTHLFFYKLLTPNHNVFGTDKQVQGQVFAEAVKEKEKKGEFPWWTNDILGGMPTQASFFTNKRLLDTAFHIISYPFFVIPNKLSKFLTDEYGWVWWFAYFGFFMYLYLRHLGCSYFASFLGGIAFLSCTGFVSLFYVGHHSGKVPVIGIMPLILYFLNLGFEKKRAFLFFALAGFFYAFTMSWHIQIFFLLSVSLVIYLFFKILFDWLEKKDFRRTGKLILFSGFLFAMGFMLNADQLLPRLEFKKYTHRGTETQVSEMDRSAMPGVDPDLEKYYFVTSFSQPPEDLLGLFMRYPFGMGKPYGGVLKEVEDIPYYRGRYELWLSLEYVGIFVFILAILGAIKYFRIREVKLIVILGIASIWLSLGKYTFLFDILYKFPGFKNFRIPLVYIMTSFFAFAGLAGFGANYIEDYIKKGQNGLLKKFWYVLLGITLILGIFALWGSFFERETIEFLVSFELVREMLWGIYQDIFQRYSLFMYNLYFLVGALILICVFAFLTVKKLIPLKAAYVLIPLAIVLDLWTLNNKFIILMPKQENVQQFMGEDNLVKFLKEDKTPYRIKSTVDEVNNRWVVFGISNIEGYHPTPLKNFEELYSLVNFSNNIDSLLNIKYLILDPNEQLTKLIESSPLLKNKYQKIYETTMYSVARKGERPVVIFKNNYDFGRAFFVYNYGVVDSNEKGLAILSNAEFNPREIAILNEKPKNAIPLQRGQRERIEFKKVEPNRVELEVENDGNAILVYSENWYPAWKAYIDGNKVELLRAYNTLRAIFVPAGKHKIEFKYESDTLRLGVTLFWIGFGALLIALGYEFYRSKRNNLNEPEKQ